jgi:hypothetical protein
MDNKSNNAYTIFLMKTIYISIPMTGYDMREQRATALAWQWYFEKIGYTVINPFELADQLRKSFLEIAGCEPTEAEYLHEDLMNLHICTDIFLCNGCTESYGCMEEVDKSIEYGLKFSFEKDYKIIDPYGIIHRTTALNA